MQQSLEIIREALATAEDALTRFRSEEERLSIVAKAGVALGDALANGARVFSCGNGGSLCDAMHFAEELSGKFREPRRGLAAIAISDPSHITCVANDFGYDEIFSRYIEAHARPGDFLLAISTSGTSRNVVRAAEAARELGVRVIALTGKEDGPLAKLAEFHIPATARTPYSDRVQEMHIKIIHILIQIVEARLSRASDR